MQYELEGEARLEERQRPVSLSVFEDTFEISPSTSVKEEAVEEKPTIAARWETFRQNFPPMPGMLDQK